MFKLFPTEIYFYILFSLGKATTSQILITIHRYYTVTTSRSFTHIVSVFCILFLLEYFYYGIAMKVAMAFKEAVSQDGLAFFNMDTSRPE